MYQKKNSFRSHCFLFIIKKVLILNPTFKFQVLLNQALSKQEISGNKTI